MSYKTVSEKQIEILEIKTCKSVLGKRKFNNVCDFDDARYGQHIGSNFFDTNVGHNYIYEKEKKLVDKNAKSKEQEILEWCKQYLASKQLY